MDIEEAKEKLKDFLAHNALSSVDGLSEHDKSASIKAPWGDKSIYLRIPDEPKELFDVLNSVVLPERFTAIWHRDTKDLEVLYTTFPLEGDQAEVGARKFIFTFGSKDYVCEFGRSSERVLLIAEHAFFAGASRTEFRNLPPYQFYIAATKGHAPMLEGASPVSFWVRNVEWHEEGVVELARHINFYMSYYDASSPVINIHPPKPDHDDGRKKRERFVIGKFPDKIIAAPLNSNLMHFWAASRSGDAFRRFLYSYQVLEFASFYFVEDQIKRAVKKALITPHVLGQMEETVIKIIDQVQESKIWEGNKMDSLLKELVEPNLVWREVEKNREYFTKTIEFDGGFVLKPLVVDKTSKETFEHDWHSKFNQTIRQIRNALSHGKEQRMSSVIAPTPQNFANIQPWTDLISVCAGEVVVYYSAVA